MTETEKMDEEKRKKELEAKRKISFPLLFGGGDGGRTQNHLSRSPAREWREFLERIARSCILRDGDGEKREGGDVDCTREAENEDDARGRH